MHNKYAASVARGHYQSAVFSIAILKYMTVTFITTNFCMCIGDIAKALP